MLRALGVAAPTLVGVVLFLAVATTVDFDFLLPSPLDRPVSDSPLPPPTPDLLLLEPLPEPPFLFEAFEPFAIDPTPQQVRFPAARAGVVVVGVVVVVVVVVVVLRCRECRCCHRTYGTY